MALRVLLADESSTIKKVIQLSLQDYAVEVQTVSLGDEVVQAAEKVHPDIVFVDVLLQKMNGYEVCAALKNHPQLNQTPIVLMWSGFMQINPQELAQAGADGQLEKPFDVAGLRDVVKKLVPKTKTQQLSQFLTLPTPPPQPQPQPAPPAPTPPPPSPEMTTSGPSPMPMPPSQPQPPPAMTPPPPPTETKPPAEKLMSPQDLGQLDDRVNESKWTMENFESLPKFDMDTDPEPTATSALSDEELVQSDDEDVAWVQKNLERYRVSDSGEDEPELEVEYEEPKDDLKTEEFLLQDNPAAPRGLSEKQTEELIRAEAQKLLESVIWKVVPELAEQIIQRELKRLLAERDRKS